MSELKDVIVIGAGPAGMTAAMYAARAQLDVMMIEQGAPGGMMNSTDSIENYPGFLSIKGMELGEKMYQNTQRDGVKHVYGIVTGIEDLGETKKVQTTDKEYEAKVVIIATGGVHRFLNVPGEEEYGGRGVSYCAVCDGAFFKDKDLIVVGGGDSAIEEGIYLTQLAHKVTVVHRRDSLRAKKDLQEQAFSNEKMNFIWDSVVEEIVGDGNKVTGAIIRDVKTNETQTLQADGVFVYIGMLANTEAFKNLGICDEQGWIKTNELMQTSVKGIYAVGDVRQKALRQVTTAVGDGTIAGQEAFNEIKALN